MKPQVVLGLGTGQCGLSGLAEILSRQPGCELSFNQSPLMPWARRPERNMLAERLARIRSTATASIIGDCSSSYLPYCREILETEPDIKLICLTRPRDEIVANFIQYLHRNHSLPINHWNRERTTGWHHDPIYTRMFPQYQTVDRESGIRRYWDEYQEASSQLAEQFPGRFRLYDPESAFDTESGLRELLSFVGIPAEQQVLCTGRWGALQGLDPDLKRDRNPAPRTSSDPMDPRRCVVLIPFHTQIVPSCEESLKELERRGYCVRRVGGYAAIDQGRNQMAADALVDGFEETFWIDADVGFPPDSIDRIRSHQLPMVTGMCAQKGRRAMATHIIPGTTSMVFGEGGGLYEVMFAGTGFLHVRREVYMRVLEHHRLPICNERFNSPTIPFFHPILLPTDDGTWYLAEDYSFAQRARSAGFQIFADTTIRLWHYGNYAYGWEDAGRDVERFDTFTLNFANRDKR